MEDNNNIILETKADEPTVSLEAAAASENSIMTEDAPKKKLSKKTIITICVLAVVVIAVVAIASIPSKFERVKDECNQIAGFSRSGKGYFTLDTVPDLNWDIMDSTMKAFVLSTLQKKTLEAIQYANDELGFNGAVYNKMLETTALMGRQTEENSKYRVSWTYHPDRGLEVTYEKK